MWWKVLALVVAAAAVIFHIETGVQAAASRTVRGTIISQQVTGPNCTSPVGLCTVGEFRGGLGGSFEFTATSLTPSADTPTTGVVFATGDITLHTRDGDLFLKDAAAFRTTSGDVASVSVVTGGTGKLMGATGTIRIAGLFQMGCVDCRYEGSLTTP